MILDNRDAVLFDLDGTLLPFAQDAFIHSYFGRLARKMVPLGYDRDLLIHSLWAGTKAMMENDGRELNCNVFWSLFVSLMGRSRAEMEPVFYDYYAHDFDGVQEVLTERPNHRALLRALGARGCSVVLATTPLFPPVAVETRLRWVGLELDDFDYITTYENSRRCKPSLDYYQSILTELGRTGDRCVMVGNSIPEDMPAAKLGMETFLVTDHLENPEQASPEPYRRGSFAEMEAWLLA